jgi:transcriptional regulator with XRE-family HTH domain
MEKSNIYIGEVIRSVMADNQITKAELARRLGVRPQSVDYMLTRKSIDTDTLYNVSRALNYDFAMLYSLHEGQTNEKSKT